MKFFGFLFFLFTLFTLQAFAQEPPKTITADTVVKKTTDKFFLRSFPIVFVRPETGWGGGLAGTTNFSLNGRDDKTPASQINWVLSYTENKQFLALMPFNLYFKNRKFYSEGELDLTNFSWDYWGNGNVTKDEAEKFSTNYKRLIFNLMTKISGKLFGGLKFEADDFPNFHVDNPTGLLATNTSIEGRNGGFYKGVGTEMLYDTRDNIYSAEKGWMIDMVYLYWNKFLVGDAEFHRLFIDAMNFKRINKKVVLAFDLNLQMNNGTAVPFTELSQLGGSTIMRGLYEGRYRDIFLANLCIENRFRIYKRFGGVVFGNVGEVSNRIQDYNWRYVRFTYGGGLRYLLNSNERINVRLDVGFGPNTQGTYLTVGEAF